MAKTTILILKCLSCINFALIASNAFCNIALNSLLPGGRSSMNIAIQQPTPMQKFGRPNKNAPSQA